MAPKTPRRRKDAKPPSGQQPAQPSRTLSYVTAVIKFHATLTGFDPTSKLFQGFADLAHGIYKDTFPITSPELRNVLKFGSGAGNFNDFDSLPSKEQKVARAKEFLELRTNARAYRIVLALSSNARLKAYVLAIHHPNPKYPILATICSFFTDIGYSRGTTRSSPAISNVFDTQPASPFQRLLFLASLPIIRSDTIATTADPEVSRPAKKRKGMNIPNSGYTSNHSAQQRLGWAIQTVVNAWNGFLSVKGLPYADVLFLPYLSFTEPSLQEPFSLPITVLALKEEGFAPDIADLAPDSLFQAKPGSQPPSFYADVVRDTPNLDDISRELAALFVQDLQYSISSYDVYFNPPTTTPSSLLRFYETSGDTHPLKTRFTDLGQDILSRLENILPTSPLPTTQQRLPTPPAITPRPDHPLTDTEWEPAMQKVAEAMLPHARLHLCAFHDLIEEDDRASPAPTSIKESVQLILTDPPYNVTTRDYDQITREEMTKAVDTIAHLLRKGGHGVLFCTIQQFRPWERALEKCKISGSKAFTIDKVPMVFAKHPGFSPAFPGRSSCSLQNCAEFAIHFKKNGLSYAEEKDMVSYRPHNFVPSNNYPGYKNIVDNVWGLLPGEQVRANGSRSSTPVRTAQKPVSLLKELISRFSRPGDLVVDLFAGTFSTAVACIELPEPRTFVGCEKDSDCFDIAEDTTIRRFATVASSPTTAFSISDEAKKVAFSIAQSKPLDSAQKSPWMPPPTMPPLQSFPSHIISALSSSWGDPAAYPLLLNKPVNLWPQEYQAMFTSTLFHSLRTTEAVISGLIVAPSRIRHVNAGAGVFAARDFGKGDKICYLYGSLVYSDLTTRTAKYKTYGTGPMGVTPDRFRSYGHVLPTSQSTLIVNNSPTIVYVVPPPFVVAGYINSPRYKPGDRDFEDYTNGTILHPRRANVTLVPSRVVGTASELIDFDLFVLQPLTNIASGDELYLNYD